MKRLALFIPVLVVVLAAPIGARCDQPGLENETWESVDHRVTPEPSGLKSFAVECQDACAKIKSAVETYVHTLLTVGKVVFRAVVAVAVSVAKLAVRAAVGLVVIAARWLLDFLTPF